jgi:predicted nucleic acid-binding protein
MSLFEDVMALAVQMPMEEREQLARALGVIVHPPSGGRALPLNQFVARPDPVAWRKAETGHAVLATEAPATEHDIPVGPRAIHGLWTANAADIVRAAADAVTEVPTAATLPRNSPVIAHTDVCTELAYGVAGALDFFESPAVEVRLATATYLALLGAARDASQQRRIRRFVQPYAVLSLGPMASSRSVELMLAHALHDGLTPLDALIAATAPHKQFHAKAQSGLGLRKALLFRTATVRGRFGSKAAVPSPSRFGVVHGFVDKRPGIKTSEIAVVNSPKDDGSRADHLNVLSRLPSYLQATAPAFDSHVSGAAPRLPRRHRRRAGPGAAGQRFSHAALPNAYVDPVSTDDVRPHNRGSLREPRMMLDVRA